VDVKLQDLRVQIAEISAGIGLKLICLETFFADVNNDDDGVAHLKVRVLQKKIA